MLKKLWKKLWKYLVEHTFKTIARVIITGVVIVLGWFCTWTYGWIQDFKQFKQSQVLPDADWTIKMHRTALLLEATLKDICGEDAYLGYFNTNSNQKGTWIMIVSTHSIINEYGKKLLNKPIENITSDKLDQAGLQNIFPAVKMLADIRLRDQLNPKAYSAVYDFSTNNSGNDIIKAIYTKHYPLSKTHLLSQDDIKSDPILSRVLKNIRLAEYSIDDTKFQPYMYNVTREENQELIVRFLTLSFVDSKSVCFSNDEKKSELFKQANNIINNQYKY